MKLLEGKTAIITGATRGIGKGIAEVFAKNGAQIAFTYASSVAKAEELQKELGNLTKVKGFQSDASDFESAQKLADDVINDNLLLIMNKEDWDEVIRINLDSVFNLTKAIVKPMMKQKKGSIINMSSVVGVKGNAGQANYAASKAGIIGFSKSIALELGSRNIRCNVVAPGFIETEMTEALDEKTIQEWRDNIPLKRGGTPEDIANACLYLASDLSSYVTGHVLNVNGGMLTY